MTPKKILTPEQHALVFRRRLARKYYRKNKARLRKYSAANKEIRRARAAKWRKDNRERYLLQQFKYDIAKRGNLTTMQRYELIYRRSIKRELAAKQGKGFPIE